MTPLDYLAWFSVCLPTLILLVWQCDLCFSRRGKS